LIALIIFGPSRLPELGQSLGKAIREFKKSSQEIQKEIEEGVGLNEDAKKELNETLNLKDLEKDLKL
jgi:TatA/E family protein of Tat protein translocase